MYQGNTRNAVISQTRKQHIFFVILNGLPSMVHVKYNGIAGSGISKPIVEACTIGVANCLTSFVLNQTTHFDERQN